MSTDQLEHFGVKGMRWGVKKSVRTSGDAATADKLHKKFKAGGTKSLTNKELKQLNERLNLERQFKSLRPDSAQRKAGKFVADILLTAGKAEVSKLVLGQAAKHAGKILSGVAVLR